MAIEQLQPIEPCPRLQAAFRILGKRWNALILDTLSRRPARFTEIHRAVPGLSDRVLGERLRELVDSGLITRRVDDHNVALYALTPRSERLVPGLDEIRAWGMLLLEASDTGSEAGEATPAARAVSR